jgi:hypothetical protein
MIKKKGMPITGTNIAMSKKKPFIPNAKDTSSDEEAMIAEAPSPFKNRMQTGEMPAGTGVKGAVPGPVAKPYAGLQHSSPGVKALPSGGPVGQRKPINQSGQIGGHMGWPPPARKAGAVPKQPNKRNRRFYGE